MQCSRPTRSPAGRAAKRGPGGPPRAEWAEARLERPSWRSKHAGKPRCLALHAPAHTHTHRPLSLLYRLLSLCPSHTVSPPHLTLQIHQAEAVRARVCVIERCISADGPNHSSVQENATQLNPRLSLILCLSDCLDSISRSHFPSVFSDGLSPTSLFLPSHTSLLL